MKDLEEQFNRWVAMKSYQRRLKKNEEGQREWSQEAGRREALNIRIPWHLGCFETDTLCLISLTSGCQLNAVCSAYV